MQAAVLEIMAAARAAGMPTMVLVSSRDDARAMRELGATSYVVSNDQSFLRAAASQALKDYGDPSGW
jgi:2-keto-3-deoxy-L-rhamnonate aldolase RhmA